MWRHIICSALKTLHFMCKPYNSRTILGFDLIYKHSPKERIHTRPARTIATDNWLWWTRFRCRRLICLQLAIYLRLLLPLASDNSESLGSCLIKLRIISHENHFVHPLQLRFFIALFNSKQFFFFCFIETRAVRVCAKNYAMKLYDASVLNAQPT